MDRVRVVRWEEAAPPDEAAILRQLESDGLAPERWSNGPSFVYAVHSHSYDKVLYTVEGDIQFRLPDAGRDVELRPGDRLELPAGTPHGAVVGESGVVCLEGHRP